MNKLLTKFCFFILLEIIVLGTLGLSGCSATAVPTPTLPAVKSPTRETTYTPFPTRTLIPSRTPTPTATIVPTSTTYVTATPSRTATYALPNARIMSVGWFRDYEMLLTFEIPGGVKGTYSAMMEESPFTCQVLKAYPDRLYCIGRGVKVDEIATVELFAAGNTTPVFKGKISIPLPLFSPTEAPRTE